MVGCTVHAISADAMIGVQVFRQGVAVRRWGDGLVECGVKHAHLAIRRRERHVGVKRAGAE